MSNPVMVLKTVGKEQVLWMFCPGCDDAHCVDPRWSWDENVESPTISPSILVTQAFHPETGLIERRCHSFVRQGQWEFLGDSTHALAGQTVPMVPVPDWLLV